MGQVTIFKKEFKRRICRTLGLDPKQVYNLTIYMTPDDAIKAEVGRFVYDNEEEELIREMQGFELVPTPPNPVKTKKEKSTEY